MSLESILKKWLAWNVAFLFRCLRFQDPAQQESAKQRLELFLETGCGCHGEN